MLTLSKLSDCAGHDLREVVLRIALATLGPGIASCGGGSSGGASPQQPSFGIAPVSAEVRQGDTRQFTAPAQSHWSVQEGAAGGSITSAGLYTAPTAAGTFHVIATSQATPSQTATATVTIPAVTMLATRTQLTIAPGENVPLRPYVEVFGTVNTGIAWAVREGAAGGSITPAGDYTTPGSSGTYHVVATSQANGLATATITITIGRLAVSIYPPTDTLGPAGVRPFLASTEGDFNVPDTNVDYAVLEGVAGGSMNGNRYTAPNVAGTYHVIATSALDSNASATATVTVVAAGFRPAANMVVPLRFEHTATSLANGKVLIAGSSACNNWDYDEWCPGTAAELYDPATGEFSSTGELREGRGFHTATALPDGKVLITGGGTATAELYDPATGTFVSTGRMGGVRSLHSATLLASGQVLVAGGGGVDPSLSTAEIYDPGVGTFSSAGGAGMTEARRSHTATVLPDGKVLITGGSSAGSGDSLATAELYDPATGTFTATGSMSVGRTSHVATLLGNGTVLITGGTWQTTAEVYDPTSGGFSPTGPMMTARQEHFATLLPSGLVLVGGGDTGGSDLFAFTAELYDPATGTFSQTGSMTASRWRSAAAALSDGRVLVTGGSEVAFAELYQ